MDVTSATSTGSSSTVTSADQTGFAGLGADDFMRLLITELQNQDPSEPLKSDALLTQLSTMRNLAANIELSDTLQAITGNQQLATASNFIGKAIRGRSESQQDVAGVVDRAFLRDGKAFVAVGEIDVPLTNVTDVEAA